MGMIWMEMDFRELASRRITVAHVKSGSWFVHIICSPTCWKIQLITMGNTTKVHTSKILHSFRTGPSDKCTTGPILPVL